MITLRRRTLWNRLRRLSPAVRAEQDARLREAIAQLIADPCLPCEIEGRIIPHGYGSAGGIDLLRAIADHPGSVTVASTHSRHGWCPYAS